jgi:hypothetical protein
MSSALPVAALAAIVIAGCAAATSGGAKAGAPTLAQSIDTQIAKEAAFAWTARRPLTWADFTGQPPDDAGASAARTHYTIIDGVQCARGTFEYRVVAAFKPRESWVRLSILPTAAERARALRHEQTHFDLSEVHARRLRRYFAELIAPCNVPSGDLAAAASRMDREERAAQALYDEETDNGRNAAEQARWDKDVDARLAALAKFVR